MIFSFPNEKNKGRCHLFITIILCILCLSFNLSMATNTHDITLGQALDNVKIVTAPKQTQEKRKKENKNTTASRTGKRNNTGSVQTGLLDIYSGNTVGGTVKSRHGATVAIGAADLSRIKADKIQIKTTNTVGRSVNVRDDETRFRMGTVDVSELDTGRLNIKTGSTIKGNVSVSNGQDVSIGVVEMGKASPAEKQRLKKDISRNIPQQPLQKKTSNKNYGHGIEQNTIKHDDNVDANQICSNADICTDYSTLCCPDTSDCYTINGCSGTVLADWWYHGVSFEQACNKHDTCYQTCNTEQRACDIQLYYDLVEQCNNKGYEDTNKTLSVDDLNELAEKVKVKNARKKLTLVFVIGSLVAADAGDLVKQPNFTKSLLNFIISEALEVPLDITTDNPDDFKNDAHKSIWHVMIAPVLSNIDTGLSTIAANGQRLTNKLSQDFDTFIESASNTSDVLAEQTKKQIEKLTQNTEYLIYDISNGVKSTTSGMSLFFDGMAQQAAPKTDLGEAILKTQNTSHSCVTDSLFVSFLSCFTTIPSNIWDGAKALNSTIEWSVSKTNQLFYETLSDTSEITGAMLGQTLDGMGYATADSLKYLGNTGIDFINLSTQRILNKTKSRVDLSSNLLVFTLDATSRTLMATSDFIFDCLDTARSIFNGVAAFGAASFQGFNDIAQCPNNRRSNEDDSCCVKNYNYDYHLDVLSSYTSPYDICNP